LQLEKLYANNVQHRVAVEKDVNTVASKLSFQLLFFILAVYLFKF